MRLNGSSKTIGSVEKATRILEIIAQSQSGIGVTEISHSLDCGVSATYHLLNTLKLCGLIEQDSTSKKYRIGYGLFHICSIARNQNFLVNMAQPYLEHLSQGSGETCNLIILEGLQVIYIAQVAVNNILQMFTQLGSKAPYYCTGGGKALLAFREEKEWFRYIKNTNFFRYTKNTNVDVETLCKELETIRREGIAFDREEREDGVTCIAAPIFSESGEAVAAISVSGPTGRMKEKLSMQALELRVRKVASEISQELGGISSNLSE